MNSNKLAEKTGKTKNYMHVNGDVVKREQNNYFHSSKLDKNNAEYIRNNSDLSGLKNDLKFSEKKKTYNDESGLSQTDRYQNEVNHSLDADNSDYATVDRIQVEDKVGVSYLSKEEIISKDFSALSQMDKPQIQALETNHDRNYEIYDGDNHFDVDRTQIEDETIDLHSWKEVNSKKKQADKSHNQVRPENTNFDKNSKVGVEESRDYSNIKSTKVEDPRNDDDNNFPETADFSETNFPDVNKEQVTADEFIVSNLQNNNDKAPNSDLVMKPNKELDKSDTFKVKTDKNSQSDRSNEDSDDIVTGDQRRAMQELEKQQEEINCSGEKTSDSSVKERLRQLNQELAELPLTESKHFTKVGFRTDLVEAFSPTKEMLENESVNADNKKGHMEGGEELLVERDGQFEIINSGDITASQITGGNINNNARDKKNPVVHAPLPPAFPRPKTANEHLIRASRSTQHHRSYSSLSDCTYISPYGLTPEEKQMSLKKKMEMDERRKAAEQQRKNQQFIKDKERAEAFQVWLNGIKAQESAEKKKQSDNQKIQKLKKEEELSILEKQRKEAFENWRKQKEEQKKQEKLLKQREEEELLKLHPSKSKKDCDNAFRIWLSQKNWEAKRQKAMDVQKYRLQVLFLHRAQKLNNLFWGSQQYASKDYKICAKNPLRVKSRLLISCSRFSADDGIQSFSSFLSSSLSRNMKKSWCLMADVVDSKELAAEGLKLINVIDHCPHLDKVVASILSGRFVAVIGDGRYEEEVKTYVKALSLFIPGYLRSASDSVVFWQKKPLHLTDLAQLQIAGLHRPNKRRLDYMIPSSIRGYITILDVEKQNIIAPMYQGEFITTMLSKIKVFRSKESYLAYLYSILQEMSAKAFLYYHSFCLNLGNSSANLTQSFSNMKRQAKVYKDTSAQFLKNYNMREDDRKIIRFLARLIFQQQLQDHHDKLFSEKDLPVKSISISYEKQYVWAY